MEGAFSGGYKDAGYTHPEAEEKAGMGGAHKDHIQDRVPSGGLIL